MARSTVNLGGGRFRRGKPRAPVSSRRRVRSAHDMIWSFRLENDLDEALGAFTASQSRRTDPVTSDIAEVIRLDLP